MGDLQNNPFSSLFPTLEQAVEFRSDSLKETSDSLRQHLPHSKEEESFKCIHFDCERDIVNTVHSATSILQDTSNVCSTQEIDLTIKDDFVVNRIIEDIFLITLDGSCIRETSAHLVYLEDLHSAVGVHTLLDLKYLDQAVFERIMLPEPKKCLVKSPSRIANEENGTSAAETRVMYYLYQCYSRWKITKDKYKDSHKEVLEVCLSVIAQDGQTALAHPHVLPDTETHKELLELLIENKDGDILMSFLNPVMDAIEDATDTEDDLSVFETFTPLLDDIVAKLGIPSLADITPLNYIGILHFFASRASLALAFMQYNTPKRKNDGKAFEATLLGVILSTSCIPKTERRPFEFFDNPGSSTHIEQERLEQIIWSNLKAISTEIYQLLNSMLRLSAEVKHAVLSWIGNCLHENSGKAKLWHNHMNMLANLSYVSDGFMLNLGGVLLHLCQPFSTPKSAKLTLIDPTYCAGRQVEDNISAMEGIHMKNMSEETCLIPINRDVAISPCSSFSFTTECFYMTHRSLQLGFHALHERLAKIINELRRLQRMYMDASQGGAAAEVTRDLKSEIERITTLYLSTKAHMMQPEMMDMMLKFYLATSTWLVNVAISDDHSVFHDISFPLAEKVPSCLGCLPEFVIDNVADFASFLRRFSPRVFETAGDGLEHFMTFILVFMGSSERMNNPHLRAKLAEALDGLMPHRDENNPNMGPISMFYREKLFQTHPHINQLATMLLRVFVSIEMTGQSVAFEQKFNYRRPMYEILAYILELSVHRKAIRVLASEAEDNIQSAQPPLFLRFINLLVNDAIYLLDEGLLHMSSLREHQHRRETEEFRQLSRELQQEAELNFRHTGMLAQFHNVMGKQTINTLRLITRDVASIFVHPTMVDRVAAMLNYFLLHLVGPKSSALKVHDMKEYEFKPQELVAGICGIYINLGKSTAFWEAVATDGRSYSPNLFGKAQDVLCRIGQANLVPDFLQVANNVKATAENLKMQEESMLDAPEEFLDPILGTFMYNPVLLPSSHVIVDHSTIARHLLSDQTDPFNRSLLTMDMINPAVALKARIDEWLSRNQAASTSKQKSNAD